VRTCRAEKKGRDITFINPLDQRKFKRIEDLIGSEVNKMPNPEPLGPGPEYAPEKQAKPEKKPHFGNKRPQKRH